MSEVPLVDHLQVPLAVAASRTDRWGNKGTSRIRKIPPVGPYSRPMTMVILWGKVFLISEVPLYTPNPLPSTQTPRS